MNTNTSQLAFDKVMPIIPSVTTQIMELFGSGAVNFTRSEVVAALNGQDETVQPRLSTLVSRGALKYNGETRINPKGNPEKVLVLGEGKARRRVSDLERAYKLLTDAKEILTDYKGTPEQDRKLQSAFGYTADAQELVEELLK